MAVRRVPSRKDRAEALLASGWWERISSRGAQTWICAAYRGHHFTLAAAYAALIGRYEPEPMPMREYDPDEWAHRGKEFL